MKKYEVDGKVFSDEDSAIKYCAEEEISTANISEIEVEEKTEVIDVEDLVENPDEDSVITTDEEQISTGALHYLVEHWDEISTANKRAILSVGLGYETGHKQHFPEKTKLIEGKVDGLLKSDIGEKLGRYHLSHIVDSIENGSCPFCSEHVSQNQFYTDVKLPEELSDFWKPSTRAIKGNPDTFEKQAKNARSPPMFTKEAKIKLVIHHCKSRHIKLYKLLYNVFNQFQWVKDVPDVKLQPKSSPESLSKENLEKLSKEELALEICENPELRSQLFKLWKKKLEDRS